MSSFLWVRGSFERQTTRDGAMITLRPELASLGTRWKAQGEYASSSIFQATSRAPLSGYRTLTIVEMYFEPVLPVPVPMNPR